MSFFFKCFFMLKYIIRFEKQFIRFYSTVRKTMTSFERVESVISLLATLLISVTIQVTQLEVSGILYKSAFSNCNLTIGSTQLSTPSLASCAAMCTKSSIFKAFAWKERGCWLMEMCPLSCSSTKGEKEGWTIYCPKGKVF